MRVVPWDSYLVIPDANEPNSVRLHADGSQICKVYGWTPEEAHERAQILIKGLRALRSLEREITSE